MAKQKYSPNPIPNIKADWAQDEQDIEKRPYSGQAVQDFVKDEFDKKLDTRFQVIDNANNRKLIFTSQEDMDLYYLDPTLVDYSRVGIFPIPSPYTAVISLLSPSNVSIVKGTTGNYINFKVNVLNEAGLPSGDDIICIYTFTNEGVKTTYTQKYSDGDEINFLIDKYLKDGENKITIAITGVNTLAATTQLVTYKQYDLSISSSFDISKLVTGENGLQIPYHVKAGTTKYVEWFIDGVKQSGYDPIDRADVSATKTFYNEFTNGKHTCQFRFYILIDNDTKFYSNTVYLEFVYKAVASKTILIKTDLAPGTIVLDKPTLEVVQYETLSLEYAVYDPQFRDNIAVFKDDTLTIASKNISTNRLDTFEYTPSTYGESILTISCGEDATYQTSLIKTKSNLGIQKAEDFVFELSAKGRSNTDIDKDTWEYVSKDVTVAATFNGKHSWDGKACILSDGGTMELNYSPFIKNVTSTGLTIEIDFETDNLKDDNAVVAYCQDSNDSAGYKITATNAEIKSRGKATSSTKYKPRERMKLAFFITKERNADYVRYVYSSIDGKLCFPDRYAEGDTFVCNSRMKFGNAEGNATIKIYSIRVYNKCLDYDQEWQNVAIESDDVRAEIAKNDVLTNDGRISYDKVKNLMPCLLITMPNIEDYWATQSKSENFTGDAIYTHPTDPSKNFTISNAIYRKQGTSSLSYPRPNVRLYSNKENAQMFDYEGNPVVKGLYSFKDKAQPVNIWTFKADFMESSMSHNTGIARLWNDIFYKVQIDNKYVCRTKAQQAAIDNNYQYDVRTAIDGFPCCIFYRHNEQDSISYMGQYNFNNDKSTAAVFGFENIPGYDNTYTQCWELLKEDGMCCFQDIANFESQWSTYFEGRYPDGGKDTTLLKPFVQWVNSTENDFDKWKLEKADHIDEYKMAGYYIYTIYHAAVDQIAKNAMLTTEDGVHWFFILYDNDTTNGLNNQGFLKFLYNITRQTEEIDTETGYKYAYQGHDSILFNNFEKDNVDEFDETGKCIYKSFMSIVRELAAAMFSVGLSYNKIIDTLINEQANAWGARLINANAIFKYFDSTGYLYACQGTREAHLKYFMSKRIELYESLWVLGDYNSRAISAVINGSSDDSGFTLEAGKQLNYGYKFNNTVKQSGVSLDLGESYKFVTGNVRSGDIMYILGSTAIKSLDMSDYAASIKTINIEKCYDDANGSELKKLILGREGISNNQLVTIASLNKGIYLEELDIQGFQSIKLLEGLETLANLHKFNASRSGLTSFIPSTGVLLNQVYLPANIQIFNLTDATVANLDWEITESLHTLVINNTTFTGTVNSKSIVLNWINAIENSDYTDTLFANAKIDVDNIDWSLTTEQALKLKRFGTNEYRGTIYITDMNYSNYKLLVEAFGENCFSAENSFKFDADAAAYIEGPTVVTGGDEGKYIGVAFPISITNKKKFNIFVNGVKQDTTIEESTGKVVTIYDNIKLYEESGEFITTPKSSPVEVMIKLSTTTGEEAFVNLLIQKVSRATDCNIVGPEYTLEPGEFEFTINYLPTDFTKKITNLIITNKEESHSYISVNIEDTEELNKFKLNVSSLPMSGSIETFVLQASDDKGICISNKEFTFELRRVPIDTININGDTLLNTKESTKDYTFSFLPEIHNINVSSMNVEIVKIEDGDTRNS